MIDDGYGMAVCLPNNIEQNAKNMYSIRVDKKERPIVMFLDVDVWIGFTGVKIWEELSINFH